MRRAVALVVFLIYASPAFAQPVDYPILGTKLLLKQSSSGKQKLVFQSKGPSFPFPPSGGLDDPRNAGATIEIVTPGAPIGGPFVAPANLAVKKDLPGAFQGKDGSAVGLADRIAGAEIGAAAFDQALGYFAPVGP